MLPEIINTPITIKLGGVELKAKKATLKDLAAFQEYASRLEANKEPSIDIKEMIFILRTCIAKAYDGEEKEKITEDYIAELIPMTEIDKITLVLQELGFINPKMEQ